MTGAGHSHAIADFGKDGRFHLLSIPWTPALRGGYAPARLTAKDRPNLIRADEKVEAVAAPMALIAIDAGQGSPRTPQFAAIVAAFFEKFDVLLAAERASELARGQSRGVGQLAAVAGRAGMDRQRSGRDRRLVGTRSARWPIPSPRRTAAPARPTRTSSIRA